MSRSSPLDGASAATSAPRYDLVKNCRVHPTHWLISTQVNRFATAPEVAELRAEFGGVQPGSQRNKVTIPGTGEDGSAPVKPDLKHGQSFRVGSSLPYYKRTSGAAVAARKHDPTRAKPLVVLTWLRINIERMVSAGALETTQLSRLTEQIEGLVEAGGAIDKIDQLVLPLPYCQLLKIFQIFFVFTLPFVLAPQLGLWTPIVAAFTAIGFFGLDQVGVELEGPFGVDDNDFPLLTMGLAMCNAVWKSTSVGCTTWPR